MWPCLFVPMIRLHVTFLPFFQIVTETNCSATKCNTKTWDHLREAVIGLISFRGTFRHVWWLSSQKMPRYADYWMTDNVLEMLVLQSVMLCNRFKLILDCFLLNNDASCLPSHNSAYNCLYKIHLASLASF